MVKTVGIIVTSEHSRKSLICKSVFLNYAIELILTLWKMSVEWFLWSVDNNLVNNNGFERKTSVG